MRHKVRNLKAWFSLPNILKYIYLDLKLSRKLKIRKVCKGVRISPSLGYRVITQSEKETRSTSNILLYSFAPQMPITLKLKNVCI